MNREEMNALDRVIDHYGPDELKHYEDAGKPQGHIGESLMALVDYRRNCPPPTVKEVASRPDAKPEDSQEPPVADCDSRVIEWRWAKETIGLAAVELNEAYAQLDIESHGQFEIPSGTLYQVQRRLEEAMQRLGLTNETDELPF